MMDWYDEVKIRLQKKNQIPFVKDSAFLQELNSFLRIQNHRTVVLWAFDLAEESIEVLAQKYPIEKRIGRCKRLGSRQNQNARSAALNSGLPRVCQRN
mgnify:CR=1 FL=1